MGSEVLHFQLLTYCNANKQTKKNPIQKHMQKTFCSSAADCHFQFAFNEKATNDK